METEFQTAKLGHLNFDEPRDKVPQVPLPDELPAPMSLSHLPKDILKSTTVENLISQNEDLMARLKVSLRRLSSLENENNRLLNESQRVRLENSTISDQILVLKEKDSMWKEKLESIEREKEILQEKTQALSLRLTHMSAELNRHNKYHDRIKNQVKPYISQLKEYSRVQDEKIISLENLLNQKEAQVRDIRHQIIEVTQNARYQVEVSEKKSHEMVTFYETEISQLREQVEILNSAQEELEIKSAKLHAALERQDELENEVVTLRRTKDDLKLRLEAELDRQKERINELTRQNQKLGVEHADLQIRVVEDQEKIKGLTQENQENFEKLQGLRFMWDAKSDECDKLKAANAALEKLNIELSKKVNELRGSPESEAKSSE